MNPLDQPVTKVEHAVDTLKLIPTAELAVTPDAGHFAPYSEQEKVVPIVQLFLEKPDTRIPVASAGMGYHPSETR
jgi:pimeloyl-ACP methyl ester carboxylesterase